MAAGTGERPASIGFSAGPEDIVLMKATNIDVSTNLDFFIVGPTEAIEVTIVSGTAKTGTPSVVANLQVLDLASNTFITVLSAAALTDAGNKRLTIGPYTPNVANVSQATLPRGSMRLNLAYTGTPVTDVLNNVTVTVSATI